MDHLPPPQQPLHNTPKTSLLTRANYDHQLDGFIGYPERQKWSARTADDWRKVFRSRKPDFLAFL